MLQIKAGDPFVEARVGLIGAAITELYRVRGFAQAVVKPNIQVLPPATVDNVTYRPVAIRFEVQEGPQTIVSGVEVAGTAAIPADQLRAMMALQGGKPFYRPQLSIDRDTLERAYRNQGFQGVSVISQLAFANDQQLVAITWTVREGEQIKVDRVLINGNSRISTQLIRRELAIHPGDPMSDEALIESQRRLAALGLFRRVRITELPRTGSLTRDVLIDVEETETTTIDYGGGFEVGRIAATADDGSGATDELDFGPRGFFAISRRNLWGKNRSVTLFGRVTLRRKADDPANPAARRRLRLPRLPRPVHLPRAARLQDPWRRAVHRLHRAGPAIELHLQPPRRHRRLRAPHQRLHGHRPLHLRLHQAVRRADRGGGSAADRSPVPAGQAVEVFRRRAARFAR